MAGLTNEAGLIVGDIQQLIRSTVSFLRLLWPAAATISPVWESRAAGGWETGLISFGIALIRWPDAELVAILSRRWTRALLKQTLRPPQANRPAPDLARQAREAGQQWIMSQKLAPPLLLERLAEPMPSLPHHLPDLAPDPPWPWLLVKTQARIEQAARRWQDEWLAAGQARLQPILRDAQAAWRQQADTWLRQHLAQPEPGAVLKTRSYLAAMSELLRAFVEGIEQKLDEAEADLVEVERQLSQTAERLIAELAGFPKSPLDVLFKWDRQ